MTPAFFAKVGEALYGPSWRATLAESLDVDERTVRRWASAASAIPPNLPFELAALCRQQSEQLLKLAKQLEDS